MENGSSSVHFFSDKYLENMGDVFKILYTEEQLSDVTVHCKEGSVRAHKIILAANSPYFYKIFRENVKDNPILILNGVTLNQLKDLMALLYQGSVDVLNDNIDAITSLIKEFEIKGVVFGNTTSTNIKLELNQKSQAISNDTAGNNRDTRFKGQKRVTVDFTYEEEKSQLQENLSLISFHDESRSIKRTNQGENSNVDNQRDSGNNMPSASCKNNNSEKKEISENATPKLSAWARKQRKFKCDLCPSSFKRSSHLTRHQLVHTGERPYACNQCDKAFSRHDKLKHHIKRAHEFIPDSMYEKIDADDINRESDLETKNFPNQDTNEPSLSNVDYTSTSSPNNFQRENSPLFTISHISSILEESFVKPPKKGRGRPRKYPQTPYSLKKGRGKSKMDSVMFRPGLYNHTTLPYGDLNYLTDQTNERNLMDEAVFLEPLVEIKTEQIDTSKTTKNCKMIARKEKEETTSEGGINFMDQAVIEPMVEINASNIKIENEGKSSENEIDISEIETKIGLIGECTISVAN